LLATLGGNRWRARCLQRPRVYVGRRFKPAVVAGNSPPIRSFRRQYPWVIGASLAIVPDKFMDFTLKWPVIGTANQSVSNWISTNIGPFFVVPFAAPYLTIPETPLPERSFSEHFPISTDEALPAGDPALQGKCARHHRRTKDMNMVRENDISTGCPAISWVPGFGQQFHYLRCAQDRPAIFGAYGNK
jgi:hypothetical protein